MMPGHSSIRSVLGGVLATLLCSLLAGCSKPPAPAVVTGTATATATPPPPAPATAHRIVSLSPALTEVLFAVGCGETLVARDGWSDYPAAAQRAPKLSGLVPAVEAIVAQRPDLVLTHFPPERLRAGLKVAQIPWLGLAPKRLTEIAATFVQVAKRCGHERDGRALAATFDDAVARVRASRAAGPHTRVFLELDPGKGRPFTVGRGTFLDDVLTAAGGRNVMAEAGAWVQVSAEQVIAAAPKVIFVTARAAEAEAKVAALRQRPGWQAIPAVRDGRVFAINPDLLSRPGPRLIRGLRAIAGHLSSAPLPPLDPRL